MIERAPDGAARSSKQGDRKPPAATLIDDLPLFSAAKGAPPAADPLKEALDRVDPDVLSPKAALEALYRLKLLRKQQEK